MNPLPLFSPPYQVLPKTFLPASRCTKTTYTDFKTLLADGPAVAPRRSLASEAADVLREMILLEKLTPGLPVPERDLAEALGISRTPLKEALLILKNQYLHS